MDETQEPAPDPVSPPRVLPAAVAWVRKRWGLLVAVVVPVVTVATIVIPLVADAGARHTSVDTLAVGGAESTAEPVADAASGSIQTALNSRELIGESTKESFPNGDWRVPANAPWDTFPVDGSGYPSCSTSQIAWLEKWGRRDMADIWNGYLTLTNTASDGSSLSIRNIHSVGDFISPGSPEVSVYCNLGIGGLSEIIFLKQELGSDTSAVFEDDSTGVPAGTPATLNIAPGQYVQIYLDFTRSSKLDADFSGSLVADVSVGDTTKQVVLFDGFTREGAPAISTTSLTIYGDSFTCGTSVADCTVSDFVAQLKADPAYKP